jgi:hypothetical protein
MMLLRRGSVKRGKSFNRKGVEMTRRETHSNAVRVTLLEREVATTVLESEPAALRDGVGTEACLIVEVSETSIRTGRGLA